MGRSGAGVRTSAFVFLVHSLPEGLAIGTAFASDRAGLSLFVILAIAIQNVPEGTSVAIPMAASAGFSRTARSGRRIVVELLPDAYAGRRRLGPSLGVLLGAAMMLVLSFSLGV